MKVYDLRKIIMDNKLIADNEIEECYSIIEEESNENLNEIEKTCIIYLHLDKTSPLWKKLITRLYLIIVELSWTNLKNNLKLIDSVYITPSMLTIIKQSNMVRR